MAPTPLSHRHSSGRRTTEFASFYGVANKLLLLVGVFLLKTSIQFTFFSGSLLSMVAYYVVTVGLPFAGFVALRRANPTVSGPMSSGSRGRGDSSSLIDVDLPSFDLSLPGFGSGRGRGRGRSKSRRSGRGRSRKSRRSRSRRSGRGGTSLGGSPSLVARVQSGIRRVVAALPLPGDDMDRL
ncbi:hypothetical protein [Haloarchaeobius sp. TZWWS8]|uniref:hypothetical protein n=1 Tax=Haloarchaeobius sp. TZWWS8 TaxID=3446121 RepID=UPI003EB84D0F